MKAFHAYDIRGIYGEDFDRDDVYKIGYFLPELLKADTILVGRDVRTSSPEIHEYLCRGITDAGADVDDAGLTTTPMIYWATARFGYNGSVMITASHNPKEYNGLKVSGKDAIPVGYDTGLKYIEQKIIQQYPVTLSKHKGTIRNIDIKSPYLAFLQKYKSDFSKLRLTIDCSNGMAALLVKEVLGTQHVFLYDELDGTFPNHEANPLVMENLKDLQQKVISTGSDVGIIFDGDADRVMFVDETGKFIQPDYMIALMGHYFLEEQKQKGWVIQDIRSSRSVAEYLEPMGAQMYTWRVGRAYAASKLREINGIYGGEVAGHYYFRDFYYSDSAFLACLIILKIIARFHQEGIKLSDIIRRIKTWENSGEINFKLHKKDEAMQSVANHFLSLNPLKVLDFDGYRIEFDDWWFNIRKSNTEPYLRLLIEAKNSELLEEKKSLIQSIIQQFV